MKHGFYFQWNPCQSVAKKRKENILSNDTTLEDTIRENAAGPKRVQGDSGSMEQHSLQDQIAADKYLASKEAVRRGIGIKTVKISPDGTT